MPVLWALACTLLWATISLASPPPAWNSQSTNYTSNINAILAARDLGINCQGSSSCKGHKTVAQGLVESINSFADDHVFGNEEYIACLPGPSDDTNAGFCAFLQYVGSDVSAAKIKVLAGELIKHGCKGCGQVPLNYPDENDGANGYLTFNFVVNSCPLCPQCDGPGADSTLPECTPQSSGSSRRDSVRRYNPFQLGT